MSRSSKIIFLSLITFCITPLLSQDLTKKAFIKAVQEADISYYYDEDYVKAASLYEPLLKSHPDNSNIAAKLGICYLNIDGKKMEALKLLKTASVNVVSNDKEYIEYGEKAPLDTYLYLAVAYHENDSLEKAIDLYNDFKKKLNETDVFRMDYVDNQISDCRYAIAMKKKPLTIISELFIPWLKDYPGATNPVLAKNDSVFVFTQKTGDKTKILCSYKKDNWQIPVDITKKLGGFDRFYSNSITGDGKTLVIYMDDGGDGNLYYSIRKDTTWSKVKSFGKPINTIYWESHGFITPDNGKLYFSSNRPGGFGELDIWVAERKDDGSWNTPVNCGEVINTAFNEDTPFFDPEHSALIFSSVGHISMGGYDVFRSVYRNGGWTNPVGLPFAFNTTKENTFFILNNNKPGFITSIYDDKTAVRNIYSLVAIDPADEITTTEGSVTLKDGLSVDIHKASVRLVDTKNNTPVKNIPLNEDATFKFELKPGDYQLITAHPGYKTDTINLSLPLYFLSHYMAINPALTPEKVATGNFLEIKNILFAFDSFELDETAKEGLEQVKSILISNPDFKIEVAGYTDAKGSHEYNFKLADKRARAVIQYLVSSAIPSSRFVCKAFGKSNFTAVNTNRDGSDNPEGRKYNRRVTFGIVDPQTGVVIRQETYTPERLRVASSMKYSVILEKTGAKLNENHFENLKLTGMLFIRTIPADSINIYALGVFYNKTDAIKFLGYVKENGFTGAYVVNQYDLNNVTRENAKLTPIVSSKSGKRIYTIQLKAAISPISMGLFRNFQGVKEILSEDGYYRYVMGEYSQFSKAKEALLRVQDAGFKDAFIRELNLLVVN
jgi:outer membrane protein OmpA-like peptidoglycan-associated protein/tetratricopeptide (TPR) repeat protein